MNRLGFNKDPRSTRVAVAMSGGVDSSVAASLLAADGFDVVGITLHLHDYTSSERRYSHCINQDIHDAAQVAKRIGIPHYVLDYRSRFSSEVMKAFVDSYLNGETPVPCILCNQKIKFGDLLADVITNLGAEALVTGHYVRRLEGPSGPELHRAVDAEHDQSYFLFASTLDKLAFLRFPLGGLLKTETRALAAQLGLSVTSKPSSQDICFVPSGHYTSVVKQLHPKAAEPGDIFHVNGQLLGRHSGIIYFTIGQRRGLGISKRSAGCAAEPLYVVRLDLERRQVIVGPREALASSRVLIHKTNWLVELSCYDNVLSVEVKLRSSQRAVPATLRIIDKPCYGVAPGQAAVCYQGDRMLGGGWIILENQIQHT
jgi:tRNA-specific 2-thiouridylase